MGSLNGLKEQASSFLQDKYRTLKLVLTDVTQVEELAEEATNATPRTPDARTMARISRAAYEPDEYWRIIDVLHRRLFAVDWKEWRQSYKALVVLEFLLTHGPEGVADEFVCDEEIIEELGAFIFVDERGFDWGAAVRKKSERVLLLIMDEDLLQEERVKAMKITQEIQGFGNPLMSPTSSSSLSSSSPPSSRASTSSSTYSHSSRTWSNSENGIKSPTEGSTGSNTIVVKHSGRSHLWDDSLKESGSLLGGHVNGEEGREKEEEKKNWLYEGGKVGFRSLSNVGRVMMKKLDRNLSLGF